MPESIEILREELRRAPISEIVLREIESANWFENLQFSGYTGKVKHSMIKAVN